MFAAVTSTHEAPTRGDAEKEKEEEDDDGDGEGAAPPVG